MTEYSSKILEEAVQVMSRLPGIGKKSALRLVLFLAAENKEAIGNFSEAILALSDKLKKCQRCFNYSDSETCSICLDKSRKQHMICVVESIRDVMAIEDTGQYNGLYHVLGGVISPLEGVSADDLNIESLLKRVVKEEVDELLMGISPTIEGETTIYYISKKLEKTSVTISLLSRGVAFGGELEYTDGLTLGRAIQARIPYQNHVIQQ